MKTVVVGIGDCKLSSEPACQLVTYALGSCIAVTLYDPVARIGGMLHFLLPDPGSETARAQLNPFMYAATGLPLMFQQAYAMGADKRRLIVTATGGAQMMDSKGVFNIGKRNCLEMRKLLWKAGICLRMEDVGGTVSRTVRMEVATGRVLLRSGAVEKEFLPAVRAA